MCVHTNSEGCHSNVGGSCGGVHDKTDDDEDDEDGDDEDDKDADCNDGGENDDDDDRNSQASKHACLLGSKHFPF